MQHFLGNYQEISSRSFGDLIETGILYIYLKKIFLIIKKKNFLFSKFFLKLF